MVDIAAVWGAIIKKASGPVLVFAITCFTLSLILKESQPQDPQLQYFFSFSVVMVIMALAIFVIVAITNRPPKKKPPQVTKPSKAIRCPQCHVYDRAVRVGGVDRCPHCSHEYMSNEKTATVVKKWKNILTK